MGKRRHHGVETPEADISRRSELGEKNRYAKSRAYAHWLQPNRGWTVYSKTEHRMDGGEELEILTNKLLLIKTNEW